LQKDNVRIWDGNTSKEFLKSRNLSYKEGILGPGYGWQWRRFGAPYNEKYGDTSKYSEDQLPKGVDQLKLVEDLLKNDPNSRRIILTAWNPTVINDTALPPCHCFIQFHVSNRGEQKLLSAQVYCRSQDLFHGTCFNVFSYAVLVYILAKRAQMTPYELTLVMGDAHIYETHIEHMKNQLKRDPYDFPQLKISDEIVTKKYQELSIADFKIVNYKSHEKMIAAMVI
jgi:thymidylate synthase